MGQHSSAILPIKADGFLLHQTSIQTQKQTHFLHEPTDSTRISPTSGGHLVQSIVSQEYTIPWVIKDPLRTQKLHPDPKQDANPDSLPLQLDIALVGVPFDGGASHPGTRFGPREIRNKSSMLRKIHGSTGVAPFSLCQVADVGDVVIKKPWNGVESAQNEIYDYFRQLCSR
jgi:hypothetical protein